MPHQITDQPLDVAALLAQVATPAAGAVTTFHGVVRQQSFQRRVLYLLYEAYAPMALAQLERIEQEARQRWELCHMAMAHRIGRLEVGETSLLVAVSSVHRAAALEACAYAVERLKQSLPVWKKEYWEGGAVWLENDQGSIVLE